MGKYVLRYSILIYLAMLLLVPIVMIGYRTFEHGVSPVWDALSSPYAVHALKLSVLIMLISVPVNVIFGITAAWLLARRKMPLPWLVNALINLPFAMSPVVIGIAVFALYSRTGWFGTYLFAHNIQVLFTWKAIAIATIFISLPFVVREVVPVLEELGSDQEQAAEVLGASQLQSFFRVTLPAIRWAVVYGVVLTAARALGEFGAVNIVSGNQIGVTQTLPLYVNDSFQQFQPTAAYSAGLLLAVISLLILIGMTTFSSRRRKEISE